MGLGDVDDVGVNSCIRATSSTGMPTAWQMEAALVDWLSSSCIVVMVEPCVNMHSKPATMDTDNYSNTCRGGMHTNRRDACMNQK